MPFGEKWCVLSKAHFVVSESCINQKRSQGWKGNVKARHFILALRDYYQEQAATRLLRQKDLVAEPDPDDWTIQYINIQHLQPIMEAIDDDASGFITISEINKFTDSRPADWR